jgi:uncharacterized membrane protein YtjA (UPF0391 family)
MLYWPLVFLFISLLAGTLAFTGATGAASETAAVLAVVCLALALVSAITGRRPRV